MATTAKASKAGRGCRLPLAAARILKALKQFHQGDVGFHTRTLIRMPIRSINHGE